MTKSTKPAARSAAPLSGPAQETLELVRELATILNRRSLAQLEVELADVTIRLKSGAGASRAAAAPPASPSVAAPAAPAAPAAAAPAAPAAVADNHAIVKSPFVGTFYRAAGPDMEPFVEVGTRVGKGQVLCIVEAMKLMNEIEAERAGVIAAVLVDNAQPVEYGQPLFKISAG